jgi:2-oxoglutarate dehydrogenase E2 component (dihydrolipoamide succinyltransferase)
MSLEIKIPAVGESINEVTIARWLKKEGDYVNTDDPLCELESDKATFEISAEASGSLHITAEEGQTLAIGAVLGTIDSAAKPEEPKESTQTETKTEPSSSYATGHASPAAAKILSEKEISPASVQGSGKDGRITREDAVNATTKPPEKTEEPKEKIAEAVAPSGNRNTRKERMSSLRKTISRRLVAVKNETAMLTTFNEVDMKPVMDLRKKYKDQFKEKYNIGLGFMSFFTKAACIALNEWPSVNAQINGDEIIFNDFCDISIAVSTPKGLVVPVIRNAEQMSFDQIEKTIINLAAKARDNKLSIEEMTGGTFTITNGGVFGSMLSTPIINAPQSAILGMHNIVERPVALNGEVVIRPVMYIALSYDHRIIDGKESVGFLLRIKQLLEDPARMLLNI